MLVIIRRDARQVSEEAARIVAASVQAKPTLVLGLVTGSTPVGMYRELVRLHTQHGLDFAKVTTFNLDEYLGLAAEHEQSYHYYMNEHLFRHVNIAPKNVHIPDGRVAGGYESYCESYERQIQAAGGLDLQVLGIGKNGHIGFNEPASSLASRTRVKTLTRETIAANRRLFKPEDTMPDCAITMGIGTILQARRLLLLASGKGKDRAVAKAVEGPITASTTASALQLHPDATVLLDRAAAGRLRNRAYYRRVFKMTAKLTPNRLW